MWKIFVFSMFMIDFVFLYMFFDLLIINVNVWFLVFIILLFIGVVKKFIFFFFVVFFNCLFNCGDIVFVLMKIIFE